jgi:ferrous iron transport protein B
MATRVIEDRRDRLVTMLVAPLMSCSARLPVYTLMTAAFIPDTRYLGGWVGLQGLAMLAMYVLGATTAIGMAWLLKGTLLRGQTPAFLLELPPYKLPALGLVLRRMLDNGWSFVSGAGTLILCVSVIVWAAAYFPHDPAIDRQIRAGYQPRVDALQLQLPAQEGVATAPESADASAPRWRIWKRRFPARSPRRISNKAGWAAPGAGWNPPSGRWAGIGASAAP